VTIGVRLKLSKTIRQFLEAFSKRQKLGPDEINELRKLIDNYEEGGKRWNRYL
jgi:predicted transcriptional regulator